jgi:hypothetical protein
MAKPLSWKMRFVRIADRDNFSRLHADTAKWHFSGKAISAPSKPHLEE